MEKSLMVAIEEAKLKVYAAFNQIVAETKLPPFLFECVVTDLLAEIRKQEVIDLITEKESQEEK